MLTGELGEEGLHYLGGNSSSAVGVIGPYIDDICITHLVGEDSSCPYDLFTIISDAGGKAVLKGSL